MMNSQQKMMMNLMSKPMLKQKWSNKKQGLREKFINFKNKSKQKNGKKGESMDHVSFYLWFIYLICSVRNNTSHYLAPAYLGLTR